MVPRNIKICLLLTALATILITLWATPGPRFSDNMLRTIRSLDAQIVDRPAPMFEARDLSGRVHSLSDYRGKVVVLNFWASYCQPCKDEFPSFAMMARMFSEELVVIAVSHDEDMSQLVGFLEEQFPSGELPLVVLSDPSARIAALYGTDKLPETYLIDRHGAVIVRLVNARDWMTPEMIRLMTGVVHGR